MSAPKRIQLQRTKGWRKPEGAINVARPTKWGNAFKAMPTAEGWSVFCHVAAGLDVWIERVGIVTREEATAEAIRLYRLQITHWAHDEYESDNPVADALAPLRGHDLACWCPLDEPCHADVLLELANGAAS